MDDRTNKWVDLVVGILIGLLIVFAVAMVATVAFLYWYSTPV